MVNFLSRVINDPERRKKWLIGSGIGLAIIIILIIIIIAASGGSSDTSSGSDALNHVPLIDGYNNLAALLRRCASNDLTKIKFNSNLSNDLTWNGNTTCKTFTDIVRLQEGKVATQVWFADADCSIQYKDGVQIALEQIDVLKRLIFQYRDQLQLVTTLEDLEDSFSDRKIGSIIALNGAHLIDSKLGVLRMFYDLGVRILKLAPTKCYTPWLDKNSVLTDFGHKIIEECIRLGLILDVSGLDTKYVTEILDKYKIPVIVSQMVTKVEASHADDSMAYSDELIKKIIEHGGLMMVTFDQKSLTNNAKTTFNDLFQHLDHIASLNGIDNIGLASGFGTYEKPLEPIVDVTSYPSLFDALKDYESPKSIKWNSENLEKLASKNFQQLLKKVEQKREGMFTTLASSAWIPEILMVEAAKEHTEIKTCRSLVETKP